MSFDHRYQYYVYDAKQVIKLKQFGFNEKDDNMVLVNAPLFYNEYDAKSVYKCSTRYQLY